jgi:hypothetical protein
MAQPSAILQALLTSLTRARQGSALALDQATLGGTSAAALLDLFQYDLDITSFTLGDVSLPSSVTGADLVISGSNGGVTLDLTFEDALGEVAIEALFRAPAIETLRQAFPALPAGFFDAIDVSGGTASVTAPGLVQPLTLGSARYGVVGLLTPSSGLVTTSIAPRAEGQSGPAGAKGLLVEAPTDMSGYRVAPLASTWNFSELGWLVPGLGLLDAVSEIIGSHDVALRGFDLNLYPGEPDEPGLSSVSLDIADAADPAKPLWHTTDDKVELTDVIVTLDLSYLADRSLSVPRTGSLQGNIRVGSMVLNVQIPFPPTGIWSLTAYPDLRLPTLSDIASLVNGGSGALGPALPANLGDVGGFELSYLRLAVTAKTLSLADFTVGITSTGRWPLIKDVVELESLQISLTIDGTPSVTGLVVGTLALPGGADITVSLGRSTPDDSWRLDAISPAIALPSLGQLTPLAQRENLGSLVKAGGLEAKHFVMTDLNFGLTLDPAKLTNLGLTLRLADSSDTADPLTPVLNWPIIPDVLTLTEFSFGFQITWADTVTKDVFGRFVLNGLDFDIRFGRNTTTGASTDALVAEYSAQDAKGTINVKDLIHSIAPDVAAGVPDGITINLADAVLAYLNTDGKPKFLFAMDIAVELPLTDLPLIGRAVPADATVALKNLKVVVASAGMSATDIAAINEMSAKPVLAPPPADATGDAIPAGFSVTAELQLGSLSILMTSPPPKQRSQPPASPPSGSPPAVPGATAADPVMWITVQKAFGPVTIQKVGFSYRSGGLFVVSNLSISVGGLEIDLLGFGVGSPIKDPRPEFTIDGIAVTWAEGPVEVSGALTGSIAPVVDLTGELIVGAGQLQIGAVGGYCEVDQHPSLFAFAVLDYPIGGPAFFFVTGLAGGFGFNRALVIPPVDRVADFPFVKWAQGQGAPAMAGSAVAAVIGELSSSGVVAPSVGEHWVAAGVRFTSFELVNSFALLTVVFGTTSEVALLGLSTVQLPPAPATPMAQAQLQLKAAYLPDSGLLSVSGQLTADSFVLSPDCHLTGGFALATWFGDDPHTGARAGEFVLTLGGYSPRFTPPGYYPVVPRLGLRWQVSPQLAVAGDLYFALTSSAVMAGGGLSAVWQSGNIRAWFDMEADFLLVFEPFHYYLSAAIQIGASFTIDLWFTSFAVTIHLGVALEIWGPNFTGRVTVDLSIISFTISFGDSPAGNRKTIEWPEFVGNLIPATTSRTTALAAGDDHRTPAVVQIAVEDGLLKRLSDAAGELNWIVDGAALRVTTQTAIPVSAWSVSSNITLIDDGQPPNTDFGVGPVGLANGELSSTHAVTLTGTGAFRASHVLSNVPAALWQARTLDDHGVPAGVDPLHATTVNGVATGLRITPAPVPADHTLAITIENLDYTVAEPRSVFTWSDATAPATDSFTPQDVWTTITAPGPAGVRSALATAVAAAGCPVPAHFDVSELATPAAYDLTADPVLRLLGEQR